VFEQALRPAGCARRHVKFFFVLKPKNPMVIDGKKCSKQASSTKSPEENREVLKARPVDGGGAASPSSPAVSPTTDASRAHRRLNKIGRLALEAPLQLWAAHAGSAGRGVVGKARERGGGTRAFDA